MFRKVQKIQSVLFTQNFKSYFHDWNNGCDSFERWEKASLFWNCIYFISYSKLLYKWHFWWEWVFVCALCLLSLHCDAFSDGISLYYMCYSTIHFLGCIAVCNWQMIVLMLMWAMFCAPLYPPFVCIVYDFTLAFHCISWGMMQLFLYLV